MNMIRLIVTDVTQTYYLLIYHYIFKMASVNFLAQNNGEEKGEDSLDSVIFLAQNIGEGTGENNLDSSFNLHPEEPTDSEPCSPDYSPIHSSEEEDVYIQEEEDEQDNLPDPRLELIDKQFNLKMKELFTQTSSGQLVPYTNEATLQQTTDSLMQHLTKSHPLTWVSQFKTTPEEDELPLWMSIMKGDIDVLVTQFQQQMCTRFSKVMSEMVKLYHK